MIGVVVRYRNHGYTPKVLPDHAEDFLGAVGKVANRHNRHVVGPVPLLVEPLDRPRWHVPDHALQTDGEALGVPVAHRHGTQQRPALSSPEDKT